MDSDYIITLCGCFGDDCSPLSRSEFWKLYHQYGNSVQGITLSHDERTDKLLQRSEARASSLEALNGLGIRILTFADNDFPRRLFTKLGDFCPPLLYVCGDVSFNNRRYAGYVGSRNAEEADISSTKMMVAKNIRDGFGVVSGGARGIDTAALEHALTNGGYAVAYVSDNLQTRMHDGFTRECIVNGRLTLLSHVSPFTQQLAKKSKASFVGAAMERNKFIYAQSAATAVVRSDYKKGGTWAGATEALRHKWSPVFVWDNDKYEGNQELIKLGGIPLSDDGKRVLAADLFSAF